MLFSRFRKREKFNFSAIRFDGSPDQAAAIVQLDSCFIRKVDDRGLIIEVYFPDQLPRVLTRGDWLVKTRIGGWLVLSDPVFRDLFEMIA